MCTTINRSIRDIARSGAVAIAFTSLFSIGYAHANTEPAQRNCLAAILTAG